MPSTKTLNEKVEQMKRGEFGLDIIFPIHKASVLGDDESNARWGEEDDRQLLGLQPLNVEELILKVATQAV